MSDVVVIGAGVGGLAAAIVCASEGRSVRVVEAMDRPGGKAGVICIDGVELDTGPSVLTLPGVFDDLLRRAGTSLAEQVVLRAPEPSFRYLYPDGVALDVHPRLDQTLASVGDTLGTAARDELAAFLAYAGSIWDAAAPAFVLGPAPTAGRLLRGGLLAATRIDPFRTMAGAIRRRVRSPHLRSLLLRYATYNGSDPRLAPATLNCIAHVELGLGGFGVEGGITALVTALVRAAERLGVDIRCGAPVQSIEVRGGAVRGVVLGSGERLPAAAVIANADVAHVAADLLPAGLRHGLAPPDSPSMSGLNAIVKARRRSGPGARVAHTVLFPDDYDAEFRDIFDHDRPPREPTVYLCAQEPCHGRRGWPEHEPVFLMANAPAEPAAGARSPAVASELADRMLARVVGAGLLDSDDELVWSRTPAELARLFPGSRGSIYGAASNSATAAFHRPGNVVERVPGLYLASGSAHPGGGLPLAALSGRAAAAAVLTRKAS